MKPKDRFLLIETSHRAGFVALAQESTIVGSRRLEEARRHARDLVPAIRELLHEQNWKPTDISAVLIGRGPGSYTGLRVGCMSAKTFAYASGCGLIAIDTFAILAEQAPSGACIVDVIADAQQDKIYVQKFARDSGTLWLEQTPLRIDSVANWLGARGNHDWVTGPGLEIHAAKLSESMRIVARDHWYVQPASMLKIGQERWRRGERDDVFALEPLYLRQSAAEEKWAERKPPRDPPA